MKKIFIVLAGLAFPSLALANLPLGPSWPSFAVMFVSWVSLLLLVLTCIILVLRAIYAYIKKRPFVIPRRGKIFLAILVTIQIFLHFIYPKLPFPWLAEERANRAWQQNCLETCMVREPGSKFGNWYSMHNPDNKTGEKRFCRQVCGLDPISDKDVNLRNWKLRAE